MLQTLIIQLWQTKHRRALLKSYINLLFLFYDYILSMHIFCCPQLMQLNYATIHV